MQEKQKRILVMRYRFIGDTLLSIPFLRNLRKKYPDAKIDVLVGPNSGEVLKHCPYIDELIFFDTTKKHRYENSNAEKKTFWYYVKELKKRNYDMTFVLKRSFSSALLAFLAGIPERIGFDTEFRGFLLNKRIKYEKNNKHEADCFLDVLKAVDIPVDGNHLESWSSSEETDKAKDLLKQALNSESSNNINNKKILLHVTSANQAKMWTEEGFLELSKWLTQEKDADIFSLGAPGDSEFYEAIIDKLDSSVKNRFHNLCGKTNLLESIAFLKEMDLVIGVDSGTLHMAAAAGIPVVALFGPMNDTKWAPLSAKSKIVKQGLDCQPCSLRIKCPYSFKCMQELSPELVKKEAEALIS